MINNTALPSICVYLQKHGLQNTINFFKLNAKFHSKYSNLVLLKYDQLESPRGVSEVEDCRGIIVDTSNDFKIISYPYRRFYNYGEGFAHSIDWVSAKVFEKVDGSLMTLYWYDNQWHVASSGMPDAGGMIHESSVSFQDLFWSTWEQLKYKLPPDTSYCYMFELVTPLNTKNLIVRYDKDRIVFHGARDLKTLEEIEATVIKNNEWELPILYQVSSYEEITASLIGVPPTESEGYVVVDKYFNRVKIKSPQYVALAHIKEGLTDLKLLEIVRNVEGSEFLVYLPEHKEKYQELQSKLELLEQTIINQWGLYKHIETRKEFALAVKDFKHSGILFQLYSKKETTVKNLLTFMKIDTLYQWLC